MQKNRKIKAIGLLSGGLDSILAIKVIQQQAVEVIGLSFSTPFFGPRLAQKAADDLGIKLVVKDITPEHFEIVKNPRYGYGKTMNPCIDCHALMLKVAGEIMREQGYDFIFTGEVLNERPMSQTKDALGLVLKMSGYGPYIVRPLSAKFMAPTEPEIQGLIDRERLLNLHGRSRKPQFKLAAEFGIKKYPNPAGGCLLTDRLFSNRLRELLSFNSDPSMRDIRLLKTGRHFRFADSVKLIVGRDEKENMLLERVCMEGDILFTTTELVPGPTCILSGKGAERFTRKAALICAAYSDVAEAAECTILVDDRISGQKSSMMVIAERANRTLQRIDGEKTVGKIVHGS